MLFYILYKRFEDKSKHNFFTEAKNATEAISIFYDEYSPRQFKLIEVEELF